MIKTIRERLAQEMARTGLRGKKLARAAGLNESAVRDLMQSVGDPKVGTLVKLARALGVPPGYLFDNLVPVRGLVGVGGVVRFLEDDAEPELVPKPPIARDDLIALKVVGEMLRPAYRDGDILFLSRATDKIEFDYIGDEVVAQLLDGSAYLRTLASGTQAGSHTLRHWTGTDTENVTLAWASPVLFTMRRAALPNGGESSPK